MSEDERDELIRKSRCDYLANELRALQDEGGDRAARLGLLAELAEAGDFAQGRDANAALGAQIARALRETARADVDAAAERRARNREIARFFVHMRLGGTNPNRAFRALAGIYGETAPNIRRIVREAVPLEYYLEAFPEIDEAELIEIARPASN